MYARHCAAYTLAELLIVVAVLSLAAVAAIPTAQPVAEPRADAAAGEVAIALRHARDNARHSGAQRLFDCDTAAGTVAVSALAVTGAATTTVGLVDHPFTHLPYRVALNAAPAGNTMALVRCIFTFSDNSTASAVAFDVDGNPVRGLGTSPARNEKLRSGRIELGAGHVVRSIDVDATGRITVS